MSNDTITATATAAPVLSGERERAEIAFEHALEIAPDLAEASNGLGVALRLAGRLDDARRRYEEAAFADPELAEARVNRGELLASEGRLDEAEADFSAALQFDPDLVPARLDRARGAGGGILGVVAPVDKKTAD